MSLSNTDLIFLANIVSAGEIPIGLGVICTPGETVVAPYLSECLVPFQSPLQIVYKPLSACLFDLRWYCGVVM